MTFSNIYCKHWFTIFNDIVDASVGARTRVKISVWLERPTGRVLDGREGRLGSAGYSFGFLVQAVRQKPIHPLSIKLPSSMNIFVLIKESIKIKLIVCSLSKIKYVLPAEKRFEIVSDFTNYIYVHMPQIYFPYRS